MIWLLAPVFLTGAAGGWYATKETAADVLEASQADAPLVNVGNQSNISSTNAVLMVIGVVLLAWFFFIRKGKK